MKLGDIRGAFLSAGQLPKQYRPLYASLPAGGIPGVPDDALIEITGHVYGLNDSPSAWYRKLDSELHAAGFERSKIDSCIYYMREDGKLSGVYGIHVDDCATGGYGKKYEDALNYLKQKFEFRKWRNHDGDFCGARYVQDPVSKVISMSQQAFAQKLRPLHFSRERMSKRDEPLNPKEVACLRAINGSLNWLCTQSRPDLSAQVSFSQQSFPEPKVQDALNVNNAVRRAKQHSDQNIVFSVIPPEELCVMMHSDAAFGNARAGAMQAGYVVSLTSKAINVGKECAWTPVFWRSFKLPRVVSSTLSAEAQSMSVASSMCEWTMLLLSEALDGFRCPHSFWHSTGREAVLVTDCKSLYDHLQSPSTPALDDRRTSIDIIIIKDSIRRLGAQLRWIPTNRMLADAMTKESPEAFDLLRACIRVMRYQISPEESVLKWRAKERERRKQFATRAVCSATSHVDRPLSSHGD